MSRILIGRPTLEQKVNTKYKCHLPDTCNSLSLFSPASPLCQICQTYQVTHRSEHEDPVIRNVLILNFHKWYWLSGNP